MRLSPHPLGMNNVEIIYNEVGMKWLEWETDKEEKIEETN